MLKIREIENRIISQSIGGVNNSARAESDNNISKKPDEKSKNIKILAGASALAAIAQRCRYSGLRQREIALAWEISI